MSQTIQIRPYRSEDLSLIEKLDTQVQPYRSEDQGEGRKSEWKETEGLGNAFAKNNSQSQ